jgi:hypothetical protein
MQAMDGREAPRHLPGFVQIDDAYLEGESNCCKPGCDTDSKQAF